MSKRARLLAITFLLLGAAGCNYDFSDIASVGPAVNGVVLDAQTQAPIEGAVVSIAGRQSTTAATGTYYIIDVPRGTQTITATKAGYANYSGEVMVEAGLTQKTIHMTK